MARSRSCKRHVRYFAEYQLTEEQRLRRSLTLANNQLAHTDNTTTMAIDFLNNHNDQMRLLNADPEFNRLLRDYLKQLAQHYWNNYENPTVWAGKSLMKKTAELLGLGMIPRVYAIWFRESEAAFE